MRCAIIADIHANLAALKAVLVDVKQRGGVEEIWCLGDIVGYGPDPHDCIELLRQTKHICVVGNHDLAAVGQIDTTDFNPDAVAASEWTAEHLNSQDVRYIKSLPRVINKDDFTIVHGSPREPIWEYVLSISGARENFAYFKTQFCLLAHTHVPAAFSYDEGGLRSGLLSTRERWGSRGTATPGPATPSMTAISSGSGSTASLTTSPKPSPIWWSKSYPCAWWPVSATAYNGLCVSVLLLT